MKGQTLTSDGSSVTSSLQQVESSGDFMAGDSDESSNHDVTEKLNDCINTLDPVYTVECNYNIDEVDIDNPCISCDLSDEDSSEDSSNLDSDVTEVIVVREIAQWAIEFNISLVALSAILNILRKLFPELPKGRRTVLATGSKYYSSC